MAAVPADGLEDLDYTKSDCWEAVHLRLSHSVLYRVPEFAAVMRLFMRRSFH